MRIELGCALLGVIGLACATGPAPVKEPPLPAPDVVELFRRARFAELARRPEHELERLAGALSGPAQSAAEDRADWGARTAYRRGDATTAATLLRQLPAENQTRRLLEAMFTHVDPSRPLRASARTGELWLPLDARALDRGFPVLEGAVLGRRLSFLWDTGSSENVLSPAAADRLDLATTAVEYTRRGPAAGFVVRFEVGGSEALDLGPWRVRSIPWVVTELDWVEAGGAGAIDGVLSPQLLLGRGCFAVDRRRALLGLGFDPESCARLLAGSTRAALFSWDGAVFASARLSPDPRARDGSTPELAVQLETGSPVSFLRAHAARWLPRGMLGRDAAEREGRIAHDVTRAVRLKVADRERAVEVIDLTPSRPGLAHDDIATLGNDLLLEGGGVAVSFATMELGTFALGRETLSRR